MMVQDINLVLKPVPKDDDPDDWPCHILQQAVIRTEDGKSMVNLLEAELHGPFIVQGKLEVEKQYKSQLLSIPRKRTVEILSDSFSVGDGPDDQVTIWAGGRGGWFEIVPSAAYQEEYENMAVAVKLYYAILDITQARWSRKNILNIDKIFDTYSAKEHDSTLNREDVAELCRIHGVFLLSMMRRPTTTVDWKATPIFKWLVQELPEVMPLLAESTARRVSRGAQSSTRPPSRKLSKTPPLDARAARMKSREKEKTLPIRQVVDFTKDDEMELDPPSESLGNGRPSSAGRGKMPPIINLIDDEMEVRSRESRRSGKGAALRLATPRKRPRSNSNSDDDENRVLRSGKRRKSLAAKSNDDAEELPAHAALGDQDVAHAALGDQDVEEEGDEDEIDVELAMEESPHKDEEDPEEEVDIEEQLQLSLESVNMPSFEPCGPDGLWKCPRKGCKWFVHGVEEDATQEEIRSHFLRHAEHIKAQLARFKTVKQESRPHLPINHLLEKLRRLGEASRLQEEAAEDSIEGKPVPKLIKRKMIS